MIKFIQQNKSVLAENIPALQHNGAYDLQFMSPIGVHHSCTHAPVYKPGLVKYCHLALPQDKTVPAVVFSCGCNRMVFLASSIPASF